MSQVANTPAIPYEILRRSDGLVALSCNAGLMPKEPFGVILHPGKITVMSDKDTPMVILNGVPPADLTTLYKQKKLYFIEAMRQGIFSEKEIPVLAVSK